MKIDITKDWCANMAEIEGDAEIGAGLLARDPVMHTPGPWRTQGWVPTWAYIPVHDAHHNLVCSVYPSRTCSREEVLGNAHLITAAPALLEALEAAYTYITQPRRSTPTEATYYTRNYNTLVAKLRAALNYERA